MTRPLHAALCALAALLAGPAGAEAPEPGGAETHAPALAPEIQARFASVSADPAPKAITNAKHYLVSNEKRLGLFKEAAWGRGGVLVGVGTDQNYVLAGWARPEVLFILDFDQVVIDVHDVYRAFFLAAESADQLRELWTEAATERARGLIRSTYAAEGERQRQQRALAAYELARPEVEERLAKLAASVLGTFLDTPAQYDFVRGLYTQGRVFAVRGDLTGGDTLRELARAARESDLVVRVLYLSNAEQYFMYNAGRYRDNVLDLPLDGRSVVLRTLPARGRPEGFEYLIQTGESFRAWLQHRRTWSVYNMWKVRRYDPPGQDRRALIDAAPGTRPGAKKGAKRRSDKAPAPPP